MTDFIVFAPVSPISTDLTNPVPVHGVLVAAEDEQAAIYAVIDVHMIPPVATDYRCIAIGDAQHYVVKHATTVNPVEASGA